jgi:hypothetical protein
VILRLDQVVTWVHVPKPTLDLVGLVLGALTLAAVAALVALVLGSGMGLLLIARNRRREGALEPTRLGLLESSHP